MPAKRNTDTVNHPSHYNAHPSGVECIDIIRWYTANVAMVFKHLWRAGLKQVTSNDHLEDYLKAQFYLNDEIERLRLEKEREGWTKQDWADFRQEVRDHLRLAE